jgi:hypothetical protein
MKIPHGCHVVVLNATKTTSTKVSYFLFHDPVLNGASVAPISSQFRASAMLLLLITGNEK